METNKKTNKLISTFTLTFSGSFYQCTYIFWCFWLASHSQTNVKRFILRKFLSVTTGTTFTNAAWNFTFQKGSRMLTLAPWDSGVSGTDHQTLEVCRRNSIPDVFGGKWCRGPKRKRSIQTLIRLCGGSRLNQCSCQSSFPLLWWEHWCR